jgi:diacylglycerol kinase (ATP)
MYISAADKLYPQKTAVLLNPYSGRIRKRLERIRELAAAMPGAILHESDSLESMNRIIDELAGTGVDHVVIAGGDGTVQAVLDRLYTGKPWSRLPLVSIVPGGTTNMTATDIGSSCNPEKCLQQLGRSLQNALDVRLVTRSILQIRQDQQPDIHGMFFGTGLIARGSEYFHKHVKKSGLTGESGSALVMLRVLAGLLTGRNAQERTPIRIRLTDDTGHAREYNCMLLFTSTLDRLLLGLRPYWGGGHGAIHTTCLREHPDRLWRSLLAIVCGRGNSLAENDGYYSRNNSSLELMMDAGFIVDGEFFHCESRHGPLRISQAGPIRFLLP